MWNKCLLFSNVQTLWTEVFKRHDLSAYFVEYLDEDDVLERYGL